MSRQQRITKLLITSFQPLNLEVIDESHKHAGHAGARPEGETHFAVIMSSPAFAGQSRIERHRRVQAVLQPEFDSGLHALRLQLSEA